MIKDIEVYQWDYEVYFERDDWIPRLVRVFDSRAEAEKCVNRIKEHGLEAWLVDKCELTFVKGN